MDCTCHKNFNNTLYSENIITYKYIKTVNFNSVMDDLHLHYRINSNIKHIVRILYHISIFKRLNVNSDTHKWQM